MQAPCSGIWRAGGYQVACAEHFDDVLSEFAAFDPQLVLLDISLPFFNGYHWCREIRKVSKVPILFLTSASFHARYSGNSLVTDIRKNQKMWAAHLAKATIKILMKSPSTRNRQTIQTNYLYRRFEERSFK